MKISVIIPVYNALDEFKKLIKSLNKNFNFDLGEILIINDCSNFKTEQFINSLDEKFKIIHNEINLGYLKSANKGMKLAQNEIIVLLNSDTIIPSFFAEKIISCFKTCPNIATASPIRCDKFGYYINFPFWYSLEKINKKLESVFEKCSEIPSAEGFCYCINKNIIEKIGYFDEKYNLGYHEEVDYSFRAIQKGYKNYLIENLCVYHKKSCSFGKKRRMKLINQNNWLFYSRWSGFREKYMKENGLSNPVKKVKEKLFSKFERIIIKCCCLFYN